MRQVVKSLSLTELQQQEGERDRLGRTAVYTQPQSEKIGALCKRGKHWHCYVLACSCTCHSEKSR